MSTPPAPSYTSRKLLREKTPFQLLHPRDVKSEYQPRIAISSCRQNRSTQLSSNASSLLARLGSIVKPAGCVATPAPVKNNNPSVQYKVLVNEKPYDILRKIGSGGSAKVYEGYDKSTNQTVAIKIISLSQADTQTQQSYFNERAILTKLQNSEHVVRIHCSEYKADCKELVIVMEKGELDLSHVLDDLAKKRVSGEPYGIDIKFYWQGMLLAVSEIHRHGIVHADLKPVNFITIKNRVKLIDFGIASSLEPDGTSIIRDYQIGTINYMAPEALKNRASDAHSVFTDENSKKTRRTVIRYNFKADIWSLGCILYNFVYGRPPFDKYPDMMSKKEAITNPNHVIEFPAISNQNLRNCMETCLKYYPDDRPSADELLKHPYLKEDVLI